MTVFKLLALERHWRGWKEKMADDEETFGIIDKNNNQLYIH
jgi:hypothetical protein